MSEAAVSSEPLRRIGRWPLRLRLLPVVDRLRRLLWVAVMRRLPARRRTRYLTVVGASVAVVWVLTAAYLVLAPVRYRSHLTLILPSAGTGATVSVDKIGQVVSNGSSPFAQPTLSPTEGYKRLLSSDVTLAAAAAKARMPAGAFPAPKIKLIDQTGLIEIDVTGRTAQGAQTNARALRDAFLESLDNLRRDEAFRREAADRAQLIEFESKVRDAERRLLEFQARTGLVSVEQFNNRISALDSLRDRERQQRTFTAQTGATTARLSASLKANPVTARQAFLLKADPEFQTLLTRYAAVSGQLAEKAATLGDRHGTIEELKAQSSGLHAALATRGHALTGLSDAAVMAFADLSVSEGRGHLMESLVGSDSALAGAQAALSDIRAQIREQESDREGKVADAARLGDLTRDLKLAEAVFSSALAKVDTTKADPFASYPLVQTFEEPSLPTRRDSPSLKIALAGAVAAHLMLIMGFGLLWMRKSIDRKALLNG